MGLTDIYLLNKKNGKTKIKTIDGGHWNIEEIISGYGKGNK